MSNKRTNKRNILKRHHISFNKNKSDKKSQDELHQQKFNRATRKFVKHMENLGLFKPSSKRTNDQKEEETALQKDHQRKVQHYKCKDL